MKRATSKGSFDEESNNFELTVNDIAPQPEEDFMPPVQSFIYSVHFYYAIYNYKEEFWAASGMAWAAELEKFMAPPDKMTPVVQTLVSPGDTTGEKLRKIYAAVMMLDNTRFSRTHESNEDRAAGLKEIKTTLDIWNRKSGTDDQLTDLLCLAGARSGNEGAGDEGHEPAVQDILAVVAEHGPAGRQHRHRDAGREGRVL